MSFLLALEAIGVAGGWLGARRERRRHRLPEAQTAGRGQGRTGCSPSVQPGCLEAEAIGGHSRWRELQGARCTSSTSPPPGALRRLPVSGGKGRQPMVRPVPSTFCSMIRVTAARRSRRSSSCARHLCGDRRGRAPLVRAGCGEIQSVGSDHCPFYLRAKKDSGLTDFTTIPSGLAGIRSARASALLVRSVLWRLSLERWIEVCSSEPARLFGLYPAKERSFRAPTRTSSYLTQPPGQANPRRAARKGGLYAVRGFRALGLSQHDNCRGQVICRDGAFVVN